MFILARGGQSYARLRFNIGPGADITLPVEVEYRRPFAASNIEAWQEECLANVRVALPDSPKISVADKESAAAVFEDQFLEDWRREAWDDYLDFERAHREDQYDFTGTLPAATASTHVPRL